MNVSGVNLVRRVAHLFFYSIFLYFIKIIVYNICFVLLIITIFVIMEYNYDEVAVQELLQWADTAELPQSLRLDQAAFIFDVRRCVESDTMCVRDHYPDPFYNPAINWLYQIREMTDKKSNIK